jgi:peptidoglycan/LPS O-acetylase OafA/YrhL
MMTINGVTWSLAVEAQLYLLAFLLVPVIAVQKPAVQWRAFGLAVAIALAVRALTFWATADPALRSHGSMQTPALLDGFMAGVLISLRLAGNDAAIPDRRAFARWVAALVVALSLLALAHYAYTRHMDNLHTVPYMSILHRSLVAAGCAGLVLAAVWLPHRLRVPSALLWLGRVSYGIYLWHGVLLFGLLDRFGAAWSLDAKAVFVLLGSLLLADASYRLVERPTQRWILRRFPTAAELAPRQDLRAP